jgi:hypothetical protein
MDYTFQESRYAPKLPTTMDEIADVALAALENLPSSVVSVSVLDSRGAEVTMSRTTAKFWASGGRPIF